MSGLEFSVVDRQSASKSQIGVCHISLDTIIGITNHIEISASSLFRTAARRTTAAFVGFGNFSVFFSHEFTQAMGCLWHRYFPSTTGLECSEQHLSIFPQAGDGFGVDAITGFGSVNRSGDQPSLFQHLKMLRHGCLRKRHDFNDLTTYARAPFCQTLQNCESCRMRQSLAGLRERLKLPEILLARHS